MEVNKILTSDMSVMLEFLKRSNLPHIPYIKPNKEVTKLRNIDTVIYDEKLQNSLLEYKSEAEKISICVTGFENYLDDFEIVGVGGQIRTELCDEPTARRELHSLFSTIKGLGLYEKYFWGEVRAEKIRTVYGELTDLFPDVTCVKTYTMQFVISPTEIKEVTLHEVDELTGKYILSILSFKITRKQ